MCFIETFFLNPERIRDVMSYKIKFELEKDLPARHALENPAAEGQAAIVQWLNHYRVLMGIPADLRLRLVDALVGHVPEIRLDSVTPALIDSHTAISKCCSSVVPRDFTSLGSKVLWLLHPEVVPIFDSQASHAISVVARLANKVPTPDLKPTAGANKYCTFVKLHTLCFAEFYGRIDETISEQFSDIFDAAAPHGHASSKEDAKRQYANHVTVIDQLLWHLGDETAIEECLAPVGRRNPVIQIPLSVKEIGISLKPA